LDFDRITISPLEECDIPTILEIECDSQLDPWNEKAFVEETKRVNSKLMVARLSTGVCGGAPDHRAAAGGRNAGVVAGYICFWAVGDEIQILNLAVRKSLRRIGVARRLIEFAIQTGNSRHARFVSLEVRQSNLAARKLYESLGFRVVGERPGYYGVQKESAILMELEIRDLPV